MAAKHSTTDNTITFEPSEEVERLINLYGQHRDAARALVETGAYEQAERHREMSVEFLRQARRLALGGDQ